MTIRGYQKQSSTPVFQRLLKGLVGLGVIIGFIQVFETNTMVAQGYQLNNLKEEITQLIDQNQDLKTQISGAASFANLADIQKALKLVPANEVSYIAASGEGGPVAAQAPPTVF